MRKKAFTLIELLVVIAIIGILAGIVLVSLSGTRARARDAKRQADIRQIYTAMQLAYDDSSDECGGQDRYFTSQTMPQKICPITGQYLSSVPTDPLTNQNYTWLDNSSCPDPGAHFCVYARLETTGKYFAASEKGVTELDQEPTNGCACW